ncbi:Nif3-like dinuclear metal center hexameric protein [Paenibacillus rhizovicinus]|uniref:GTP cyclohydrolase 1 type 2 homolog n=1 Tax=Paenibacillus rhizovicinus TaxID=2704463 RepID=A0A6C0P006_9BACL|nr:Nif3-like dinuclear metal center hexameric protein [Paenibacillus rhizovicinus]QHW31789.1 Nif3-like dinuclear metal center hexameric protein [Paenibacillus rhizovicinus]
MYATGQTIIERFEQWAPKRLALPNDRIGLQLGTLRSEVRKVLVALDVTEEVVEEAIREQVELIIAHHAIIFRPLEDLQTDQPAGRLYAKLIKHDIAVYIAHTNLDAAEGGVNDLLAEALGLRELDVLRFVHAEKLKKLAVFVPQTHHRQVLDALFAAGVGHIGDYSNCSFNTAGEATFMPSDSARPFIGEAGVLERVAEVRIETVVPESLVRQAVHAVIAAHPYEEVAYDVYPIEHEAKRYGIGRVGQLPEALALGELASHVKDVFGLDAVRVVGELSRTVRRAAVLGGSGGKFVQDALRAGADVLITGDIDYHTAQDAKAAGLALIDAGHHIEQIMKRGVAAYLTICLADTDTKVTASEVVTEPFHTV